MPLLKGFLNQSRTATQTLPNIKMRAHLNADSLFFVIYQN